MKLKKDPINAPASMLGGKPKESSGLPTDSHSSKPKTTAALDKKAMPHAGGSPTVVRTDAPIVGKPFTVESPKTPTPHKFSRGKK